MYRQLTSPAVMSPVVMRGLMTLLPVPVGCAADEEPELLGFVEDGAVGVEPDDVRSRR